MCKILNAYFEGRFCIVQLPWRNKSFCNLHGWFLCGRIVQFSFGLCERKCKSKISPWCSANHYNLISHCLNVMRKQQCEKVWDWVIMIGGASRRNFAFTILICSPCHFRIVCCSVWTSPTLPNGIRQKLLWNVMQCFTWQKNESNQLH